MDETETYEIVVKATHFLRAVHRVTQDNINVFFEHANWILNKVSASGMIKFIVVLRPGDESADLYILSRKGYYEHRVVQRTYATCILQELIE